LSVRRLRAIGAGFALAALTAFLTAQGADATSALTGKLNPCSFVTNNDVLHLLGWTVDSRERRPYNLHGGTGTMCFIGSSQGQVVVIVPDFGSDYPGISVYNDPNATGLAQKVPGMGAEVTLYNGTVYIVAHHRDVAVRVVPDSHAASYAEVEPFAKVVIQRLH
jgi:hypothetical protein